MKKSYQLSAISYQQDNLSQLLKRRLPVRILRIIRKIGRIAQGQDFPAFIVGGLVRDLLLGRESLDLDIVVEGNALRLIDCLKAEMELTVLKHKRFGTAVVTFSSGFKIDLASARKEQYACCAALPTVALSSIKQDLSRRDFTINALAVNINPDNFGQLLDLFCGLNDLKEKRLKVLHRKSFIDDPTRILRAIRYEQRYDFDLEPRTLKLIRQAIASGVLKKLSRFRLGREFILLLKEKAPLAAILRFERLCGLKLIHPLLRLDRAVKTRLQSRKPGDDWLVYFCLLTRKLDQQQLERLCCDFSLTRADKQRLNRLRSEEIS